MGLEKAGKLKNQATDQRRSPKPAAVGRGDHRKFDRKSDLLEVRSQDPEASRTATAAKIGRTRRTGLWLRGDRADTYRHQQRAPTAEHQFHYHAPTGFDTYRCATTCKSRCKVYALKYCKTNHGRRAMKKPQSGHRSRSCTARHGILP